MPNFGAAQDLYTKSQAVSQPLVAGEARGLDLSTQDQFTRSGMAAAQGAVMRGNRNIYAGLAFRTNLSNQLLALKEKLAFDRQNSGQAFSADENAKNMGFNQHLSQLSLDAHMGDIQLMRQLGQTRGQNDMHGSLLQLGSKAAGSLSTRDSRAPGILPSAPDDAQGVPGVY